MLEQPVGFQMITVCNKGAPAIRLWAKNCEYIRQINESTLSVIDTLDLDYESIIISAADLEYHPEANSIYQQYKQNL